MLGFPAMTRTHYFYFRLTVKELETLVEAHQIDFDHLIKDSFSDDLLLQNENFLDDLAAVIVQPILSELSFDDFYADPNLENEQRAFFGQCRSSLCLENLPYFQTNPLQVTYLLMLLERISEALIDQGGVSALVFKGHYIEELRRYKNLDSLLKGVPEKILETKTSKPVHPIDFVIQDIYREVDRLQTAGKIFSTEEILSSQSEKVQKLFAIMRGEKLDAGTLLKKSGLIPKDFGDYLERLKFSLKKIL